MAYEKQTWDTGTVIPESKLLHIEDGIAEVESEMEEGDAELNSALAKLGSAFQVTRFTGESVTINSGVAAAIEISITVPSGYTALGCIGFYSGNANLAIARANMNSGPIGYLNVRNVSNSNSYTVTPWVEVLFVKTSLL